MRPKGQLKKANIGRLQKRKEKRRRERKEREIPRTKPWNISKTDGKNARGSEKIV